MNSLVLKFALLALVSLTLSCKNQFAQSLVKANEVSLEPIAGYYKADDGDLRILLGADGRYRITRIIFFGENQGFSIAYMKEDKAAALLDISTGTYKAESVMGKTLLRFSPQTDSTCKYPGFRFKDITTMTFSDKHISVPERVAEDLILSRRALKLIRKEDAKFTPDDFPITNKERQDFYIANNIAHFSGCIGYDYENDSISFGANAKPLR